jgi:hypothetical protein
MRQGIRAGVCLAVLALLVGCSSAPDVVSEGARRDELKAAAAAVGPVTSAWTAVETASICDGRSSCRDSGVSFVSRRTGGSPQTVCAEAVPWVARSFGVTYSVADCVRAMTGPADSTTTQPGFSWNVLVPVRQVAGAPATWQVSVYADDVDGGRVGSGATPVPLSYQAGGYLYDGDRVAAIASLSRVSASPS